MPPPPASRSQPALPQSAMLRMGFAAALVAALLYLVLFWQPSGAVDPADLAVADEPLIAVPQLDSTLLQQAKDSTREQRLFLEAEPFSHLLAQALNVSDDAGRALGMPSRMVPVEELRADPAGWRGRWLFYRGVVEDLTGPRQGNPVPGYGIYEATLRLANGDAVLFAFSKPPASGIRIGGWARAEGYLLKLRDVMFPKDLRETPLLVGAQLREDYEDWAPVTELVPENLAPVIDVHRDGDRIEVSNDAWRSLDEDQSLPLWHLGAYARDSAPRTFEEWRLVPALNAQEVWDAFKTNSVERGTPMRVIGTLAMQRTITAAPNPASIREWTEAWLQVADLGGKTVPIWVPKSAGQPLGSTLEVRAFYYRRYAYETRRGVQLWTPLFVAADLDPFVFDTGTGMKEIGLYALGGTLVLLALVLLSQRRERRRSLQQEEALLARKRQRRTRLSAASGDAS